MKQRPTAQERRAERNGALFMGAVCFWGLYHFGHHAISGPEIHLLPAFLWLGVIASGLKLATYMLRGIASLCQITIARRPTQLHGSSRWVLSLKEIRHQLSKRQTGPFWGMHALTREALFSGFEGSAVCLGIPGSAKTTACVVTNILSIRASKIVLDLKGELTAMLAETLRARGEVVRVLNIGGQLIDLIGEGETFNPVDVITDLFFLIGGLEHVTSDLREMSFQILPEENGGSSNERFFHSGSIDLLGWCVLYTVLICGREATMGRVNSLITNPKDLLQSALFASGQLEQVAEGDELAEFACLDITSSPWCEHQSPEDVDRFSRWFRAASAALVEIMTAPDNRTYLSFLAGARQALEAYNITTRTNKILQTSSFRFAECKDGKKAVTTFLVADPTRLKSQRGPIGLVQWAALTELKRHKNLNVPTYVIADEVTNFKIESLTADLTLMRGFNVRFMLIFQSLAAYKETYGEEGLQVMWGMSEIKQILPGTAEPQTLTLLEQLLGNQSWMTVGFRGDFDQGQNALGKDYSFDEKPRPLLTKDEIRRCPDTLLFIRNEQPMRTISVPYAAIHPWRLRVAGNPYHGGKKYRLRTALRLKPGAKTKRAT